VKASEHRAAADADVTDVGTDSADRVDLRVRDALAVVGGLPSGRHSLALLIVHRETAAAMSAHHFRVAQIREE
jgi:hypothetical protein